MDDTKERFGRLLARDPVVKAVYQIYMTGGITTWEEMLMRMVVEVAEQKGQVERRLLAAYQTGERVVSPP